MTRLAPALIPEQRRQLSIALADIAVSAVSGASMKPLVLTSDPMVTEWACRVNVDVIPDWGGGLSQSVTTAVSELEESEWAVTHADLPLITSDALEDLGIAAASSGHAIAPSIDGGTNVIAGTGPFRFSYGPGSFHRHLASAPTAAVVSIPELAIEIDTEAHLAAMRNRLLPSSLRL